MLTEFSKESYQRKLTVFGIVCGLIVAIILLATGIAAAPFTGGLSLVPLWLGLPLFCLTTVGSFASAFSYVGKAVDTFVDGREKVNNERLATVVGCVLGLGLSVLALLFSFTPIAWLATLSLTQSQAAPIFIPLAVGMLASACSYIGRGLDALMKERTVLDFYAWLKTKFVKPENETGYSLVSTSSLQIVSRISISSDDSATSTSTSTPREEVGYQSVLRKPLRRTQSAPDLGTLYTPELVSPSFTM